MLSKIFGMIFPKMFLSFGGGDDGQDKTVTTENKITQLPDYPESTGARQSWWDTLQKWSTMPGYGAIQPDWDAIWNNAQQKVQQYFMGGPSGPGAVATVRSNLARRGQSENPASEASLARLGMQQGNLLQDLAVEESTKKADLSEKGRETWLTSLMALAGLKPQFATTGQVQTTDYADPTGMNLFQSALSSLGAGFAQDQGSKTSASDIDKLLSMFGSDAGTTNVEGGGGTEIGDIASIFGGEDSGDFYKDPNFYIDAAKLAAMYFA